MGLTKILDNVKDDDALFLGDILSSGYFGAELAEIHPGDTVAVIGAGPVGLCAAMCAGLFGAGDVIMLDIDPERLELAKQLGLATYGICPSEVNAEEAVRSLTQGRGDVYKRQPRIVC